MPFWNNKAPDYKGNYRINTTLYAFNVILHVASLCMQYSRLSKQYGMEIYLKKEHLHYTGSVKERGVLYLLNSLAQVKPVRRRLIATG